MNKSLKEKLLVIGLSLVLGIALTFSLDNTLTLQQKEKNAQDIFLNLQQYTNGGIMFNNLIIVDVAEINAWTDGNDVYITKGILEFTKTNDEIAFVLGHELGHVMLGHFLCYKELFATVNERNADKYGAYLAIRAGYNMCAGKAVWKRMVDTYGAGEGSSDGIHPSNIDRENSLDFPSCQSVWS